MNIKWNEEDLADPNNDLCTQINEVYADIVHNNVNNQWFCLWDSRLRFGPFDSRELAIAWFDLAINDLRRGQIPEHAPGY